MLGLCEAERGSPEKAAKHFRDGLKLSDLQPDARRALAFELGAAYETLGRAAEAIEQYQSVAREEPGFRDVAARLQRLGGGAKKGTPKPPAGGPGKGEAGGSRNRKIGFV